MRGCLELPFACFIHPSMHVVNIPKVVEHGGICGSNFARPAWQANQGNSHHQHDTVSRALCTCCESAYWLQQLHMRVPHCVSVWSAQNCIFTTLAPAEYQKVLVVFVSRIAHFCSRPGPAVTAQGIVKISVYLRYSDVLVTMRCVYIRSSKSTLDCAPSSFRRMFAYSACISWTPPKHRSSGENACNISGSFACREGKSTAQGLVTLCSKWCDVLLT